MKMVKCPKCDAGDVEWCEDGRMVTDMCYHCAGSGEISEDLYFLDQLFAVATTLASLSLAEMIKNRNEDPEGEGWDFCAAENMMSVTEYTQACFYDEEYKFRALLTEMDRETQEVMVAWDKYIYEHRDENRKKVPVKVEPEIQPEVYIPDTNEVFGDDDIPF